MLDPALPADRAGEAEAFAGLVPPADVELLRQHGLHVEVLATELLDDGNLGATLIDGVRGGPWTPRRIRVAGNATGDMTVGHILLHEVGHAVNVLRRQERSEEAADAYAAEAKQRVIDAVLEGRSDDPPPVAPATPATPTAADPAPAASHPGGTAVAAGALLLALLGVALLAA